MSAMISMIVNRCHISNSNTEVIRTVISTLKEGHDTFSRMSKYNRRQLMKLAIEYHQTNVELFYTVMTGKL